MGISTSFIQCPCLRCQMVSGPLLTVWQWKVCKEGGALIGCKAMAKLHAISSCQMMAGRALSNCGSAEAFQKFLAGASGRERTRLVYRDEHGAVFQVTRSNPRSLRSPNSHVQQARNGILGMLNGGTAHDPSSKLSPR
jgi:hypothetical protein